MTEWKDHIAEALKYQSTHTLADVEHMINEGFAVLWIGENSAAVTEVIQQPRQKDLSLWLCGGNLEEICEVMLPKAEEWAKRNGCTRLLTSGRPGWNRVMKKYGYTPVANVCAKEINP